MSDDDDRETRILALPSPFALEPGTVRLLEPEAGFSSEQLDQLREGTLGRPFMIDFGLTRSLFLSVDAVQSSMRMDDPNALVAAYTRKMMAFLLFRPSPRHVLMIGLGGGSLAKFCYRHLPRARITVVEIDAQVIALRDQFSIPRDHDRFEVIHDDGASFLASAKMQPDIILIDAFDESGVSPTLAAPGVYQSVNRCLSSGGVLVMNLCGEKSRYMAHIKPLRDAFSGSIRLVPVECDDNVLLFAFKDRSRVEFPDSLRRRAVYLEQEMGLEFSRFLERLRAGQVVKTRDVT